MIQRLFVAIIAISLLSALSVPVLAEYIPPGEVSVDVNVPKPETTDFSEGSFRYAVKWQGLSVATAEVNVRNFLAPDGPFFYVEALAKSSSAVSLFYRLRHKTASVFNAKTLRPTSFSSWQKENSRVKENKIYFDNKGSVYSRRWSNGKEEDPISFEADDSTFGPISAAFLAMSQKLSQGEKTSVDVFNGRHRYLITFEMGPKETIWLNRKPREAYRVMPTVKKLTDTEGEKKLKSATLWISADGKREILRLESKVWIGSVTAELRSYDPSNLVDVPVTTRAQRMVPVEIAPL